MQTDHGEVYFCNIGTHIPPLSWDLKEKKYLFLAKARIPRLLKRIVKHIFFFTIFDVCNLFPFFSAIPIEH